jgi:chromosome segregation ATPase
VSHLEAENEALQGSLAQAQAAVQQQERQLGSMEAELQEHQQRVRDRRSVAAA